MGKHLALTVIWAILIRKWPASVKETSPKTECGVCRWGPACPPRPCASAPPSPRFWLQGSGCWVQGAGCRVQGSGFGVLRASRRGPGSGFRDSDFGFRVPGFGNRVLDFEFRVWSFGFRISDFGCRVSGGGCKVQVSGCDHGAKPVYLNHLDDSVDSDQ